MNQLNQLFSIYSILMVDEMGAFISPEWERDLYLKIEEFLSDQQCRILYINGMADHIHILFNYEHSPKFLISIMDAVKEYSALWINRLISPEFFRWKSKSPYFRSDENQQIKIWSDNILNQKSIHKVQTFTQEYIHIIEQFSFIPENIH